MTEQHARDVVSADHPSLAGHFPGRPIVPGVLLLERVLQAAAGGARLAAIPSAKFLEPLRPGEPFDIHWTRSGDTLRFRCLRDGRLLAQGAMTLAPRASP